MKILLLGDASNLHNTLAVELRREGHSVVVASDGSRWMDTDRDITLRRGSGIMGTARYLGKLALTLPRLRGYDVVQLAGPMFLQLRPEKLRHILSYLRKHNRRVMMTALATDPTYYAACHDGTTYRYSDYRIGSEPSPFTLSREYRERHHADWTLPAVTAYHAHLLEQVDGVVACLWEYYAAYRRYAPRVALSYSGIPIDTDRLVPQRSIDTVPERIRLFIGIQRERTILKGTDRLLAAARRVAERHPSRVELDVVENLPYKQYIGRMAQAHVILDQLYSYTPATNALIGMAQGLVALSGAEPEYYSLIGETANKPIVNVSPLVEGDIERQLEALVERRDRLPAMAAASRAFVVKHNAAPVVASRFVEMWRK